MTAQVHPMNLKEIVDLKERELSEKNEDTHKLDLALQSIQHRINYCEYHYSEIEEVTNKKALLIDRLSTPKSDEIPIRTIYEANTFAFIQNLHALIDSLPYALNIFITVCPTIEHYRINWNNGKFIKSYESYPFYASLMSIHGDEIFAKLKSLNNRVKHKHIVRIRNNPKSLLFDNFTYKYNGQSKSVLDEDVKTFLEDCYNHLLPKFMGFWNEVRDYKKTELEKRS
ncbi:hypothetical protein [Kushneria sp. EE4]